jgi:uncharacterized protein YkwD
MAVLAFMFLVAFSDAFPGAQAKGFGSSSAGEIQVLQLINQARGRGTRCAGGGGGVRLGPLVFNSTLRATAKQHASNMNAHGFVAHFWRGVGPRTRVARAGYRYLRMSEIIYMFRTRGGAASAVRWWLRSPVHCRAIMSPYYTQSGAGYGGGGAWVVILAQPRRSSTK